jgi:hypothetical protein
MRPKPRAIMPSTVNRIISMWHNIMLSIAEIQSARVQLRKSPGRRPSALFTRMSGSGQASSAALRPSGVVISAATGVTVAPSVRISAAVRSSASRFRATIVTATPSRASAIAQARPSPRLAPLSSAFRPAIPRSMPPSGRRPSTRAFLTHSGCQRRQTVMA